MTAGRSYNRAALVVLAAWIGAMAAGAWMAFQ